MRKKKALPFAECLSHSLKRYLEDLNGEVPASLYDMVISQVELPVVVVMNCAENNQSRAAQMLGINRNTLRKKLRDHGLI